MSLFAVANTQLRAGSVLPESSLTKPLQWFLDTGSWARTLSGSRVDPNTAISLPTVFNALLLLSESVAQLPVAPYSIQTIDGRESKQKAVDHPSYRLVAKRPNHWMSSHTFRKTMMAWATRYDNAYALITRKQNGEATELFPIHPSHVTPKISEDRRLVYQVLDFFGSGKVETVGELNMFHIMGYTENGIVGTSRLKILAESLGTAMAAERFAGKFFGKGINASGFIKTKKMLRDAEAVERLKTSFTQKYGGDDGLFGVGVLEDDSDWIKNEIDPESAQLTDTRRLNGLMVAQMYNIPVPLLKYLEKATFNNVEQLDIQFAKYTLQPWLTNWEQEYERKLLREEEQRTGAIYFKHNLTALLRGDMAARGQFYERMSKTGAFSPNKILEKEDENTFEGGDVHVINPGAKTIEQLQNQNNDE